MRPLISDMEAHAARQSQEPPIAKPKGTPVVGDTGWRDSLGLEISRNATGRAEACMPRTRRDCTQPAGQDGAGAHRGPGGNDTWWE